MRLIGCSISISNISVLGGSQQGFKTKKWLICEDCEKLSILGSRFENMNGDDGSVFLLKSNRINSILAVIRDSEFNNNTASFSGGAIATIDTAIHIENSIFFNNSASNGGALHFNCSTFNLSIVEKSLEEKWNGLCDFRLKNNSFKGNRGLQAGGGYFWLGEKPKGENSNFFIGNKALYGSDRASVPLSIRLQGQRMNFSSIASGQTLKFNLTFFLLDFYSQICSSVSEGVMTLALKENNEENNNARRSIVGNKVVAIRNGGANFSNLNLISSPNRSLLFEIKSKAVQNATESEYVKLFMILLIIDYYFYRV
jgi:hypothetical protein